MKKKITFHAAKFQKGDMVKSPRGIGTITAVGRDSAGAFAYRIGRSTYCYDQLQIRTDYCGAYVEGKQCRAKTKLTSVVLAVQQGQIIKGPEKVVVPLCGKHFQLLISRQVKP